MIPLRLQLLGGFKASCDRQAVTNLRTDKVRGLLSYLAVENGRPQRRDLLATMLWSESSQDSARRSLRKAVHYLRLALEAASPGLSERLLSITPQDITLNTDMLWLDTVRFSRLLEENEKHDHSADIPCPDCLVRLEEAASIYGGEFMQGFNIKDAVVFDDWQVIQREKLERQAVQVFSSLAEAYEQRGKYNRAFEAAARYAVTAPLTEEAYLQMMRALALQGRKHEAAGMYERYRQLLAHELNTHPGAEITGLYEQIFSGQWPDLVQAASLRLVNFPLQPSPFFERERELYLILDELMDPGCRLLTLLGPGGVGKTRLGIEAARRMARIERFFEDGLCFVPLVGVSGLDQFFGALASSLGIAFSGKHPPREEILAHLRGKELLLVLDNCDSLDGIKTVAAFLLEELPGIRLLATSRTALNLHNERRVEITGLDILPGPGAGQGQASQAVQFFIQAGHRFRPGFAPDGSELEAVLNICTLVEGNPLALEIAAAWLRLAEPTTIAREIAGNLEAMSAPLHDLPERHRSMRAVFEHSWGYLSPSEQAALAQASLFKGGFSLRAAREICQTSLLVLASLVDKSQIRITTGERYEMHELLRQFTAEKLLEYSPESGLQAAHVKARYIEHYLRLLAEKEPDWQGEQAPNTARELLKDAANYHQAWEWAVETKSLECLDSSMESLSGFYLAAGTPAEGAHRLREAASRLRRSSALEGRAGKSGARVVCRLELEAARLLTYQSEFEAVLQIAQGAAELARTIPDKDLEVRAWTLCGWAFEGKGDYGQASGFHERALSYYSERGDRQKIALVLVRIGTVSWRRRLLAEAEAAYREAHTHYQAIENLPGVANSLTGLGIVYADQDRYEEALAAHQRSLAINRRLERKAGMAVCLVNLGDLYQTTGEYHRAVECYQEALLINREIGNTARTGLIMSNLGALYYSLGEMGRAGEYLEKALGILLEMGDQNDYAEALLRKAELSMQAGRLEETRSLVEESLKAAGAGRVSGAGTNSAGGAASGVEKIVHPETVFKGQILAARLLDARGSQQAACRKLSALLSSAHEEAHRAEIHYWQWRITARQADRQEALRLFSVLSEHRHRAIYKERLVELCR